MRAFNKNLILLFVFVLSFAVPLFVFRTIDLPIFNRNNKEASERTDNVRIISVPPKQAVIGRTWQYGVSIQNYSTDKYNVVVKKPSWLMWDKDKLLFKGDVPTNIDAFQVEIEVLDDNDKVIDKQTVEVKVVDSILNLQPVVKVAALDSNAVGAKDIEVPNRMGTSASQAVLGAQTRRIPQTGVLDNIVWGLGLAFILLFLGRKLLKLKNARNIDNIAVIKGTIK